MNTKKSSGEEEGVNILDPKELLRYAQDTTPEGRMTLATAVSGFFKEHRLNLTEQRLAGEILMNLVRQAEIDLREALSERMAAQDNVPPELVVFFANDEISVARHVLMHSPLLKDIDLLYIIQNKDTEYSQAIAKRDGISPAVSERLVDTQDPNTILSLIDNQRTHIQRGTLKKILRAAMVSESLQAPLLRRPEVDADTATTLYMVVGYALRQEIAKRFSVSAQSGEQALNHIVQELSNEARGRSEVLPEMKSIAGRMHERGDITPDLMIKTLRRGQMGFFVALFGERVGLAPAIVVRMIQKDSGKPFILACRAVGMMKSEFASLFLLSRGIRTGDKIVDQRELAMALKYFDAVREFDVEQVMNGWRKNPDMV